MISKFLVDTFGKTTYVTFIITETGDNVKLEFLPPVNNKLKSLFKSVGSELHRIVSNNPRKIEKIIIDNVKYYFSVERVRHDENIHYGLHVLYAISKKNECLFSEYDLPRNLYRIHNDRFFGDISAASCKLLKKVRTNTGIHGYLFDFLGFGLEDFFENKKTNYFYKINDVIKYTIENYFNEELCPRKIVANYINSNMYTQMNLNLFMFFMVNLFLTLIKFSQGTIEINFKNNLQTLDTMIEGKFINGFFENNEDILDDNEWPLSTYHPAFSDFEFIKYLANYVGAAVNINNPSKENFNICVSVSKIDLVFSNILRVNEAGSTDYGIPIYTADINEIIN